MVGCCGNTPYSPTCGGCGHGYACGGCSWGVGDSSGSGNGGGMLVVVRMAVAIMLLAVAMAGVMVILVLNWLRKPVMRVSKRDNFYICRGIFVCWVRTQRIVACSHACVCEYTYMFAYVSVFVYDKSTISQSCLRTSQLVSWHCFLRQVHALPPYPEAQSIPKR